MTSRERAVHTNNSTTQVCLFTELSTLNHLVWLFLIADACLGHILKNTNLTRYIYWVTPHNHLFFVHNEWLSWPYLRKYKRVWHETWFIDILQWREWECTGAILLPWWLFVDLSILNHFFSYWLLVLAMSWKAHKC